MTPSSLLLLAALALWLILPLVMRPAFRGAGQPPTPAATALLAMVLCGGILLWRGTGDLSVAIALSDTDRAYQDTYYVTGNFAYLAGLSWVALGLAGVAMVANGVARTGSRSGARQWLAGIGAYAVHAGVGLSAALPLLLPTALLEAEVDRVALIWLQQAIAAAALLAFLGAVAVLLGLVLALIQPAGRR